MMKPKRPKVIKAKLEKELERYSKRIQKLASKAYQIRQMLEDLAAMEAQNDAIMEQGRKEYAVHSAVGEETIGRPDSSDSNSGEPNILDAAVNPPVLDEQSTELRHDSPDIGLVEGSGV